MRSPIFTDNQGEIRNVSGRQAIGAVAAVSCAFGIKMWPRGGKIRRLALCGLMNVYGVLARRKILDVDLYLDAVLYFGEHCRSDVLALRVFDFNRDELGTGMRLIFLGKRRATDDKPQASRKDEGFHLDPLLDVGLNDPERAPGTCTFSLAETKEVNSFLYLRRYEEQPTLAFLR